MKEFLKNLKLAWIYTKDQKIRLILYIFCNIISIFISICIPILSAKIIVNLTNNNFKQLLLISLVILAVELLTNLIHHLSRYFSQVIYREAFVSIQTDLGKNILKIENRCIDKTSTGLFIQRLTSDTSRLADIFNVLNMYLSNIITNIGIFIAIFIINKLVFLYLLLVVIVLYLVDSIRVKKYNSKDKEFRQKNENISGFVGELVRGIRDIKMLNAEESFVNELKRKVKDLNQERYNMSKIDRNYSLIRDSLHDLFDTVLIFFLVYLIINNQLTIASALIIHNYNNRVTNIIIYLGMFVDKIKDFNLSAQRIFAIIENTEFKKEQFGQKRLDKVNGDFEFKNVSFSYDDGTEVLKDVSFKVKANEIVAFVGKSGAGKTTIFNLLCKMYDVNSGNITIDGIDIKELDKDTIRSNITIISQNPYIFNMSIKDNLRLMKKDLSLEEMIEACKLACLHDFIMKLPEKYDTIVGEGGISLSGGQRQRLAIARAFIQKTEIILFDEATSNLDNETQKSIQTAIENLKKDYTILIIAHRLSTVINSDRILFLNEGKIENEGSHEELIKKSSNYRLLYEAELNANKN